MCGVGIRMVCAVFLPSLQLHLTNIYSHLCCRENEAQMSEVERDLEGLVKFSHCIILKVKSTLGWSW